MTTRIATPLIVKEQSSDYILIADENIIQHMTFYGDVLPHIP